MKPSLLNLSGVTLTVERDFNKNASTPQAKKAKRKPVPFSLRLTVEEREYLEGLAGNQPLPSCDRSTANFSSSRLGLCCLRRGLA